MKFAVFQVADQTIVYFASAGSEFDEWTTKHPEVTLFATREEAQAVRDREAKRWEDSLRESVADPTTDESTRELRLRILAERWFDKDPHVEEVEDEDEFRRREDTW